MRYEQRVCLSRHGETEWSIGRQHTGTTDILLTENGRAAAKLLGPVLAEQKFDVVLVLAGKARQRWARESID
jgi:broad specificity phosphatase PhoE